ncbi:MAG: alpha-L-fucosidase [Sphingobacteriales bacterium]|nr:alpha-L-fucosidase [Sphingobacteriales bacterium]MBI3717707.1 alpha-L-fucosidase [Sphingobacteriales bacterium]
MKRIFACLFSLWICILTNAQTKEYYPDPDTAIQHRLEEWKDLKFGLLMHWGTYSQWGIVESWSICPEDLGWAAWAWKKGVTDNYADYLKKYEALKTTFNPKKFNPEKWAAAAKYAGMKYMVFTTKHHDGFCMFDTKYTDYKITDKDCPFSTNPRSNVAKEVFSAFRNEGMWVGAYFSKPDWHSDYYWWKHFPPADRNPNYSIQKYPERWKQFTDYTHNQLNELVSDYGKLDILWLDGGWVRKKTEEEEVKADLTEVYEGSRWARNPQSQDIDMPRLVKEVRQKQPKLIVVDRAVPGEQQNYLTPEQHIPDNGLPYPWETCMTMAGSWSYVPGDIYKPTNELVEKLVDIVSKGGNFLLNIGPSPDGEYDDTAYTRLQQIGDWMKINSNAIYNTRMFTVFGEGDNIRFTQSKDGKTKFIFLFNFPQNKVTITKMPFAKKATVQMLGSSAKIKWKDTGNGIELSIPESLKKVTDHVWVLKVLE